MRIHLNIHCSSWLGKKVLSQVLLLPEETKLTYHNQFIYKVNSLPDAREAIKAIAIHYALISDTIYYELDNPHLFQPKPNFKAEILLPNGNKIRIPKRGYYPINRFPTGPQQYSQPYKKEINLLPELDIHSIKKNNKTQPPYYSYNSHF